MRDKKFLHLTVSAGAFEKEAVEKELDRATDWVRYGTGCWILYSGKTAATWYHRLIAIPGMRSTNFFICELNLTNRAGWLKKSVWDWINQARND